MPGFLRVIASADKQGSYAHCNMCPNLVALGSVRHYRRLSDNVRARKDDPGPSTYSISVCMLHA